MNPDLVIFDEPAIGLDIETERTIQNVIQNHFKDTTMIIIAHRDSTINKAQRRIYLEDGHLIKMTRRYQYRKVRWMNSMKSQIHFRKDKDLLLAILGGRWTCGVSNVLFKWLYGDTKCIRRTLICINGSSGFCKMFGFLRAITRYIERLLSHRTTFTMLRDVRIQFLKN